MATVGYYGTAHWRKLRAAALERDGYWCTVAGCGRRATHVDHIETRPRSDDQTPFDRLDNLRSLCGVHDAQIKERRNGRRGRNGRPIVRGCDTEGWPFSQPGLSLSHGRPGRGYPVGSPRDR